jgi:hypothetical protein
MRRDELRDEELELAAGGSKLIDDVLVNYLVYCLASGVALQMEQMVVELVS